MHQVYALRPGVRQDPGHAHLGRGRHRLPHHGGRQLHRLLKDTDCTYCGQCVTHCPTGALTARDDTVAVYDALADPKITTVVQVAPAVRAAWAEAFGLDPALATTGRLAAALRRIGFDYVFDTNFTADLTIMEEGSEFLERFTHRGQYRWPMFTSCCPGWVRFLKGQFPAWTANLSTAKSPQQMFGAVAKSYFAEKIGVDPHDMRVISVMPCVSKKAECRLPTMNDACGDPDVDIVLTTRELTRMLRCEHILPQDLPEEGFDSPLGSGTGAAVIFGATGGVMDAALRSAYFLVTGRDPDPDAFRAVRGDRPWKEAVFTIPGAGEVHVAVVSGLGNTRRLMTALEKGQVSYDFVEVMACPGGCAGGGGQPIHEGAELAGERGERLWQLDAASPIRFSHENPISRPCTGSTWANPWVNGPTTCSTRTTPPGICRRSSDTAGEHRPGPQMQKTGLPACRMRGKAGFPRSRSADAGTPLRRGGARPGRPPARPRETPAEGPQRADPVRRAFAGSRARIRGSAPEIR